VRTSIDSDDEEEDITVSFASTSFSYSLGKSLNPSIVRTALVELKSTEG
jgi:hypothetical protein